jgi:glycosyltransferase involved in cell wall biosynthesis
MNVPITIITPTTGKKSLFKTIASLEKQTLRYEHILLWDDKRDDDFLYPDPETLKARSPYDLNSYSKDNSRYSVVVPGSFVQGGASGSSLRSVGLMLARNSYVSFMDDDVWFEEGHLERMLNLVKGNQWAYCRRKIWDSNGDYLGIDNFESVGDSSDKKVPYEMVDNNCMIFARRFGTSAAVLYRETVDYNDDRLFYAFLKHYAGVPGKTSEASINQTCPKKLESMFRQHCSK